LLDVARLWSKDDKSFVPEYLTAAATGGGVGGKKKEK
jgi:hypothetical protein